MALIWSALTATAQTAPTFPFLLNLQQGTSLTNVANQSTITLAATGVGAPVTATLVVTNNSGSTVILTNGPTLTGGQSDFTATISGTMPLTLIPGNSASVALQFIPISSNAESALFNLFYTQGPTAGSIQFTLLGTSPTITPTPGAKLTFAYGSPTVSVLSGGTVVFAQAPVGQTSQLSFTVTNGGNAAAAIISIAVADTKRVFTIVNAPTAPVSLTAGGSLTFEIVFAPLTTGFSTTTLQIDTNTFTLSGAGSPPPGLPPVSFTGASGIVSPLQQPSIGVSLASPYGLPVNGILTMTINAAALAPDASVQFATGGKTVAFTVPANTTQAVFANGASQIALQSGSTAGTIMIAATFATQSGLDLTPQSVPTVSLTVPAASPQLLQVQITNVTAAGFVVGVTGLTTTHDLGTLTYQFTPMGGGKPVSYSVNVAAAAGLWFNSSAAQPFGGQFAVAVPFGLPNPGSSTTPSTNNLKSVSVTASNAQGTSQALSFTIQ